jgi:hypothetical protein
MGELPLEKTYEVESALLTIAREQAPEVMIGKTPATRKAAQDAWQNWYKTTGEKLDLVKVLEEARKPGPLLLSTYSLVAAPNRYKVVELDEKGKVTWSHDTTGYAYSVQKLPRDRVLISEYTGRKVQERTTKGEVIWTKEGLNMPIEAIRLQDGNTLIGTRTSIIEVNPEGKDVRTINRTDLIYSMTALRNGEVALVNSANRFIRLDREGKEVSSFAIPGRMYSIGGHFAIAPNGNRVTIPLYGGAMVVGGAVVQQPGRVAEFDGNGNLIWETEADRPTSVRRLTNGNVLVASRFHGTIVELDSRGKLVNKYEAPNGARVMDARR